MPPDNNTEEKEKHEIDIRQMDIDDVAAVYHLGERLFTSEDFPILYRTWDGYEVADYFTSDPDYCLVAELDERVVGFILGTTIEKEGTAWKKYGYVGWIGVDEAFQGTNLARRLYARLEDRLEEEGVRMIIADTEGNNARAIAFFEALGFSPRSEHVWLAKTLGLPPRKAAKKKHRPSTSHKQPKPQI
ncbi:MAG: GNAT family N-acetyltransferase [Chloroflexi bacterium]|nr:GNAT family N-acetyltransferase [Chloroflexota bacterium]